jgi:hypothetical protein
MPQMTFGNGIDDSEIETSPEAINSLEIFLTGSKHLTLNQSSPYKTCFTKLIAQLKRVRGKHKSELLYLHYIFKSLHKDYLTEYQQFSTIHDIFDAGRYDCVSASVLFALVFEALDVRYIIKETNYHVYIIVTTDEQQVLIETTNSEEGFITNPQKIIRQISVYEDPQPQPDREETYIFRTRVNEEISLEQLAGLQLYNLAIYHFNNQQFNNVMPLLNQALALYKSERILEFKMLLVSR